MHTPESNNEPIGKFLLIITSAFAWVSHESVQEIMSIMSSFVAITSGGCAAFYYITKTRAVMKNSKKEDEE